MVWWYCAVARFREGTLHIGLFDVARQQSVCYHAVQNLTVATCFCCQLYTLSLSRYEKLLICVVTLLRYCFMLFRCCCSQFLLPRYTLSDYCAILWRRNA